MRVGILGGGFNPPHKAHLFAVTDALSSGLFDEIWVLPCWEHAFAKDSRLLPFEDRMEMCRLAFSQWPNVVVRNYEKMYETKYTIDLIRNLQRDYPEREFSLIIGSDNVAVREQWKDWDTLKDLVGFYVIPRYGSTDNLWTMPIISSSMVQNRAAEGRGREAASMVPKAVWDYIVKHHLEDWIKKLHPLRSRRERA